MGTEFHFGVTALNLLQWAKAVNVTMLLSTVITPEVWVKLCVCLRESRILEHSGREEQFKAHTGIRVYAQGLSFELHALTSLIRRIMNNKTGALA